jgi:hypothetical protein
MSNDKLFNYLLLTNIQFLEKEIQEKGLIDESNSKFNNISHILYENDNDDILIDIMKIKHLIHYFVIQKITSKDQFNENMDDLLLFSRENTYEDDKIHDYISIFQKYEEFINR